MRNIVKAFTTIGILAQVPVAHAVVTFDWATVGNPGNAADFFGDGRVDYTYRISKHEVTNAQYVEFLNAVDPTGANLLSLYNPRMSSDTQGGIDIDGDASSGAKYQVKAGRNFNPVVFVSFMDVMRFVNWLHNGQGLGDTEAGVYHITTGWDEIRSQNAKYFMPSEDEWYKAAFHKGDGVTGNYWDFATGTDWVPYSDNPNSLNTPDDTNVANGFANDYLPNGYGDGFAVTGSMTFDNQQVHLTDAGAYSLATSPYGTFDQSGNVAEWTETIGRPYFRFTWGGSFRTDSRNLGVGSRGLTPTGTESSDLGFRVASRIPEPSTLLLGALAGLGFLLHRRSR
ncbi:MAG: PEP-CTERM sorting domain-containing protein [Planctomycetaceae bacterium]|nr:PEP-CTERM sorting domain-containing protein [Planctomycetaceae bacterium]